MDTHDSSVHSHSYAVMRWADSIGREMGLGEPDLDVLRHAALLHDLGKIAIPVEVLHKRDPLVKAERQQIRRHPAMSCYLLRGLDFLASALPGIRHHHERYDGRGYPDGLRGSQIPLAARIIAVADSYHAMVERRPYRRRRTAKEAIAQIAECTGSQFDPEVAGAFLTVADRLLPGN